MNLCLIVNVALQGGTVFELAPQRGAKQLFSQIFFFVKALLIEAPSDLLAGIRWSHEKVPPSFDRDIMSFEVRFILFHSLFPCRFIRVMPLNGRQECLKSVT